MGIFDKLFGNKTKDLIRAALNGQVEAVEKLLIEGADINMKDEKGGTALMAAALNGHAGVVKMLLSKGADINVKNEEGGTALMYAIMFKHGEIVHLLKQVGVKEERLE